jgi:hypothetical protein
MDDALKQALSLPDHIRLPVPRFGSVSPTPGILTDDIQAFRDDSDSQPSFELTWTDPELGLTILVTETLNELTATVRATNPSVHGRRAAVVLSAKNSDQNHTVKVWLTQTTMGQQADREGAAVLGLRSDLEALLGSEVQLFGFWADED